MTFYLEIIKKADLLKSLGAKLARKSIALMKNNKFWIKLIIMTIYCLGMKCQNRNLTPHCHLPCHTFFTENTVPNCSFMCEHR